MIANRFVEDAISLDGTEEAILSVGVLGGSGPKPGSARRLHVSGQLTRAESLSNRVSFFIDDAIVRADSSCELRGFACPPSPRRGGGRTKVSRHHSDLSAARKPSRLQRKRSAGRRPLARHESLERDHPQHQRTASVRIPRRQDSTPSRTLTVPGAVQLPRKDLPPKERRRRIAVLIVFITCLFIVTCSVLAVIITLTHESFHSVLPDQNDTDAVRKQNEQHQNSLNRDEGVSSGFFNASSNPLPPANNNTASAHSL